MIFVLNGILGLLPRGPNSMEETQGAQRRKMPDGVFRAYELPRLHHFLLSWPVSGLTSLSALPSHANLHSGVERDLYGVAIRLFTVAGAAYVSV
jgi:hypothetical protein